MPLKSHVWVNLKFKRKKDAILLAKDLIFLLLLQHKCKHLTITENIHDLQSYVRQKKS